MDEFISKTLQFSVISLEALWRVLIWIFQAAITLGIIIVALVAVWTVTFVVLKKIKPEWAVQLKEISFRLLKEQFQGSMVYESLESLVESIYEALSSLINTLALTIALAFTGFSLIIAFPFRILQIALDRINLKLSILRMEQKHRLDQNKKKISDRREKLLLESGRSVEENDVHS
jgi:hypothetical protein